MWTGRGRAGRTAIAAAATVAAAALAGCGSSGAGTGEGTGTTQAGSSGVSDGASAESSPPGTTSREVSFDADGTRTYGTFEIPAQAASHPVAAALLIAGSGPTDRDGNQPPSMTPSTLKVVADLLAQHGIASLRFDKAFSGETGFGPFTGSKAADYTMDDLVGQARAAYDFLVQQPEVDTGRLLIVGHSEGGKLALALDSTVAPAPAGLALLEPSDARFLDSYATQWGEKLDEAVQLGQITAIRAQADKHQIAQAVAAFRAGRTVDASGLSAEVVQLTQGTLIAPRQAAFLRTDDQVDPVALAAKVSPGTHVLVTDGTEDKNIPPNTIGPLVEALRKAGAAGPGFDLIRGIDHEMHTADQAANEPVLALAVVSAITVWAQPFA